jgi:Ca2+-binding EF-hand superfamily protein
MEQGNDGRDDELQRLFSRFDIDGSGSVDEAEFRRILEALGEDPSDEVLSLEFAVIDADLDGVVSFDEFADWWRDYR